MHQPRAVGPLRRRERIDALPLALWFVAVYLAVLTVGVPARLPLGVLAIPCAALFAMTVATGRHGRSRSR